MTTREWVEVAAATVDEATQHGLAELGLEDVEQAEVEVIQEPTKGFLGMGGQDAIVRVRPRPKRRRRRSRGRSRGGSKAGSRDGSNGGSKAGASKAGASKPGSKSGASKGDARPQQRRKQGKATTMSDEKKESTPDQGERKRSPRSEPRRERAEETEPVDREAQAAIVNDFLTGLLGAFGLEGDVDTRVEDEIIFADVSGDQTEALVGAKGAIMQAIHELTRTVVQRKSQANARLRLDIAGYGERRREALRIYAGRLAEKVLEEGGEIMLEPMNAAERKVVHDVIVDVEGVSTYSEGEDPNRSVVISRTDD